MGRTFRTDISIPTPLIWPHMPILKRYVFLDITARLSFELQAWVIGMTPGQVTAQHHDPADRVHEAVTACTAIDSVKGVSHAAFFTFAGKPSPRFG